MALPLSTNGRDFAALLETSLGRMVLEVMAGKVGWTPAAMRAELFVNGPLAQYFVNVLRDVIAQEKAEEAGQ